MRIIGIGLLLPGIFLFVARGFNFKTKEEVVDTGTIEINKTETKTISWPRYAGGIAVVAGIAILIMARKKK